MITCSTKTAEAKDKPEEVRTERRATVPLPRTPHTMRTYHVQRQQQIQYKEHKSKHAWAVLETYTEALTAER